ncbi:NAD(P)/FAD-dependent oxidoreductase [Chloroflexota bacterium]
MYDVIVIGGGPAGSYAAYKLAEKGHKVLVLERKRQVGESVCCIGIIGQECVNTFAIENSIILRHVNSARLFSPSGILLNLWREKPQACILDRAAFDVSMATRAQEVGADYTLNSLAKGITIEKDGVNVEVYCQGKGTSFEARAAVVASGFGSSLCHRLGLGRFGDFTIGAQAEVKTSELDELEVYFGDMAPGFFAWLVPTTPTMARAGLMSREKPGPYLRKWLAHLASQGRIASAEAEISYGGIPLKPLPRTYSERLLVIGDAAGQVKPISGGGIYYGLLAADIAVKTMHQALEDGDLSAKRLAQYERGWRKKLWRELKIDYWARRLFEHLSDRKIDRIFEIVKANGIDIALLGAEDLSFDWHSKTILRLIRYQMVAKAIDVIKLPFRNG